MKYKNISGSDQFVIGIGKIKDGETKEMPKGFNNPNFEIVEDVKQSTKPLETNDNK